MNVVMALALVTLLLVLAFLCWNLYSLLENQKYGIKAYGIGGINDPMAGATPLDRSPEEMRKSLDAADRDV